MQTYCPHVWSWLFDHGFCIRQFNSFKIVPFVYWELMQWCANQSFWILLSEEFVHVNKIYSKSNRDVVVWQNWLWDCQQVLVWMAQQLWCLSVWEYQAHKWQQHTEHHQQWLDSCVFCWSAVYLQMLPHRIIQCYNTSLVLNQYCTLVFCKHLFIFLYGGK